MGGKEVGGISGYDGFGSFRILIPLGKKDWVGLDWPELGGGEKKCIFFFSLLFYSLFFGDRTFFFLFLFYILASRQYTLRFFPFFPLLASFLLCRRVGIADVLEALILLLFYFLSVICMLQCSSGAHHRYLNAVDL